MPYDIDSNHSDCPKSKPVGLYKKGDYHDVRCHPSAASAGRQRAAIEAAEKSQESTMEDDEVREESSHEKMYDEAVGYVPSFGVTSFEELEEMQDARKVSRLMHELTAQFHELASNIISSPDVEDKGAALSGLVDEFTARLETAPEDAKKESSGFARALEAVKSIFSAPDERDGTAQRSKAAMKRENGVDFPARDFAIVPDPSKPSTWKLRLTESPGKVTAAQLGRAAAAFSSGGFRGQRVQLSGSEASAAKRRIRAEYRKLGVSESDIPQSVKKDAETSFSVWKTKSGRYRWFAFYSNNYRDDDFPPEIISEKSHETFVELVDKGVVPYPELWHWHIPGTRWGQADWVAYENGFSMSTGLVDEGHEKEAEILAQMDDVRVSHGMPSALVRYNPHDSSVIEFHVTREISPLPGRAAANPYTGFAVLKENPMSVLSDAKKAHLRQLEFSEEQIANIEQNLESLGKQALSDGRASKESSQETEPEPESTPASEPESEPETQPTGETQPASESATDPQAKALTKEEITEALNEVVEPVKDGFAKLHERISTLEATVKELQTSEEQRIAQKAADTPMASLRNLVEQMAVGNEKAQVDGRTKEAKDGPKETEWEGQMATPSPFLNGLINRNGGES